VETRKTGPSCLGHLFDERQCFLEVFAGEEVNPDRELCARSIVPFCVPFDSESVSVMPSTAFSPNQTHHVKGQLPRDQTQDELKNSLQTPRHWRRGKRKSKSCQALKGQLGAVCRSSGDKMPKERDQDHRPL
jgi:hypothetical protein